MAVQLDDQVWLVTREQGGSHVIVTAMDREHAKHKVLPWFGHDPEKYIVTPLTEKGATVKFDIIWSI